MSGARVSVVLCTYQGTKYLREQLQSILAQTLQPCEVIAFDDRSSDDTVAQLEQFRQQAPFPVRIQVQPVNRGSTHNFDTAMQAATGEYLALCDQDDIWFPDKLATLAAVLDARPEVGGVFSDAALVAGDPATKTGKTLWQQHRFHTAKRHAFRTGQAVRLLLQHDIITGATLMLRSSLLPLLSPIPGSWVHDGWIAWMLAVHSHIELVERPLIGYRIHGGQQLGVAHGSRKERLQAFRRSERDRYARVAGQFADLLQRLEEQQAAGEALRAHLTAKIAFLNWRAALPHAFWKRASSILAAAASYRRYARGWRSMRKDLLLG